MSFYGSYFSFDGIPCTNYGLMMYKFGSADSSDQGTIVSGTEIIEDRINRRYAPLYYGKNNSKPLTFNLTFGADINSIDKRSHIDRWDIEAISAWLTGVDGYRWLEIDQPDMEHVRYKCIITDLKYENIADVPWGFTCTVRCDSPYAYAYPQKYILANNSPQIHINNKGAAPGGYKPLISIEKNNKVATMVITNTTISNGRSTQQILSFDEVPSNVTKIIIDNENETIENDAGINLYPYFNFNFLKLIQGDNALTFTAMSKESSLISSAIIKCEFPVQVGG